MSPGALRRVLAALAGLLLGGLGSLALVMVSLVEGWVLVLPPVVGLVVGAATGDRGIRLLARGLEWM